MCTFGSDKTGRKWEIVKLASRQSSPCTLRYAGQGAAVVNFGDTAEPLNRSKGVSVPCHHQPFPFHYIEYSCDVFLNLGLANQEQNDILHAWIRNRCPCDPAIATGIENLAVGTTCIFTGFHSLFVSLVKASTESCKIPALSTLFLSSTETTMQCSNAMAAKIGNVACCRYKSIFSLAFLFTLCF